MTVIASILAAGGTLLLALWPAAASALGAPGAASSGRLDWAVPLGPTVLVLGTFLLYPTSSYFLVLRASVTTSAILLCITALRDRSRAYFWLLCAIAVLFNPIVPVYLHDRSAWVIIDTITLGVLWLAAVRFRGVLAVID